MKDTFGFTAFQTGMAFTAVGLMVILNQGFLLHKFWLVKFSESTLEVFMLVLLAVSTLLFASGNLVCFALSLIGLGTGQANLRVVLTSQAAAAADPMQKGETLGILSALMSAYMATAPVLSGFLFEQNRIYPYVLSALLLLFGIYYSIRFRHNTAAIPEKA